MYDSLLRVSRVGPPPTLIKVLIQGSLLLQGTSINLLGSTSPHLNVIDGYKWYSSHPHKLISGKIIQEWGNYHFFLG